MEKTVKPCETEKAARVSAEIERLSMLFTGLEPNKRDYIDSQIKTLAWLTVSIEDLKQSIDDAGTSLYYNNGGGQTGVRVNPDIKTLVDYQKQKNFITKQLIEFVVGAPVKSYTTLINDYQAYCATTPVEERIQFSDWRETYKEKYLKY